MNRGEDLERYPLAKEYGWRAPKGDTGGILYLYPPRRVARQHQHNLSGEEVDFHYITRERFESLNPDDFHEIKLKTNGDPATNKGRSWRYK